MVFNQILINNGNRDVTVKAAIEVGSPKVVFYVEYMEEKTHALQCLICKEVDFLTLQYQTAMEIIQDWANDICRHLELTSTGDCVKRLNSFLNSVYTMSVNG